MLCEENELIIPSETPFTLLKNSNDRNNLKAKLLDCRNARPLSNFQHQNKNNEVYKHEMFFFLF